MGIFGNLFGGSNPQEITKTQIKTSINTMVENNTKNIQNSLSKSVNSATTSLVSEVASSIQQSTSGANVISTGGDMIARKRGKITIDQKVSVDTINKAAIQIASDNSTLTKMAASVSADMSNKLKNDSELKASLQAVNSIKQTELQNQLKRVSTQGFRV